MTMSAVLEDPANHPDYPMNLVSDRYPDLLPLFQKKGADKLPPHRYVDHGIPLKTNKEGNPTKPSMGRMYSI